MRLLLAGSQSSQSFRTASSRNCSLEIVSEFSLEIVSDKICLLKYKYCLLRTVHLEALFLFVRSFPGFSGLEGKGTFILGYLSGATHTLILSDCLLSWCFFPPKI